MLISSCESESFCSAQDDFKFDIELYNIGQKAWREWMSKRHYETK